MYTPIFSVGKKPVLENHDILLHYYFRKNATKNSTGFYRGLIEGINEVIKLKLILVLDHINTHPYFSTQMIA